MSDPNNYNYDSFIHPDEEQNPFFSGWEQQLNDPTEDHFASTFDPSAFELMNVGQQGDAPPSFLANQYPPSLGLVNNPHPLHDFDFGDLSAHGATQMQGGVDGDMQRNKFSNGQRQGPPTASRNDILTEHPITLSLYNGADLETTRHLADDSSNVVASSDCLRDSTGYDGNISSHSPNMVAPLGAKDASQDLRSRQASTKCQCPSCCLRGVILDVGLCPGRPTCLKWSVEGWKRFQRGTYPIQHYQCPISDCEETICDSFIGIARDHIISHFERDGKYRCPVKSCDRSNKGVKRFADVKRHATAIHCKNPETFHCRVVECKYHNRLGFSRKDKLTSHIRNCHPNLLTPKQGLRKLKLAPKKGESPTASAQDET